MKIALISLNKLSRGYTPLGIAYLAGNLREKGHRVRLYDAALTKEKEIIKHVERFLPKVVGLSFMTPYVNDAKRMAQLLKKEDRVIIAGGPHATTLTEHVLSESSIDYVVRGEGEVTLQHLCSALEGKMEISSIKGISYRDDKKNTVYNPPQTPIEDLDSLPPPAFELLPMEKYIRGFRMNPHLGFKGIILLASRGCPYNCIFCYSLLGKSPRYRSVSSIVREMARLKKEYKLEGFNFCDDALTLKISRIL